MFLDVRGTQLLKHPARWSRLVFKKNAVLIGRIRVVSEGEAKRGDRRDRTNILTIYLRDHADYIRGEDYIACDNEPFCAHGFRY